MLPRTGSLFRRHLDNNLELLLVYLFLTGAAALPFTGIGLYYIFHHGRATAFPPEDPHVAWTPNPDHRGSFNIIWVCISTIFTCVYVSVHIDVPDQGKTDEFQEDLERRVPGKGLRVFFAVWRFVTKPIFHKIFWLLFNVFAPELMVLVALCERRSANSGVAFMRSRGQEGWTMRHAFFADMGGFKLPDGTPFLTGRQFYQWFDEGRPKLNYKEIENDIRDQSKANVVLKLYTCSQASWMLVETVLRFIQHQPVSELEVTTCSYIVCAIITYGCWLRKPYGVDGRITLHPQVGEPVDSTAQQPTESTEHLASHAPATPPPSLAPLAPSPSPPPETAPEVASEGTPKAAVVPPTHTTSPAEASSFHLVPPTFSPPETVSHILPGDREKQQHELELPKPIYPNARSTPFNRAYDNPDRAWSSKSLMLCSWRGAQSYSFVYSGASHLAGLAGAAIGVLHGVPFWNTLFVNTQGQWLWRACCGVQVFFPPALALIPLVEWWYDGIVLWVWMLIMVFVYCISRTALFVLIGLSFWSLPAGVYRTVDWFSGVISHWH